MTDFIIGLTGGVASGKSALSERFQMRGVAVIDADVAARDAVAIGSEGLAEVVAVFGADALDMHGALDRAAMRRRVFDDANARERLETIIHPRVRIALQAACTSAAGAYAIAAIPLLAEGGGRAAYPWLDRIVVVDVPRDMQVKRLLDRDGIDLALAQRMIDAQTTRRQRLAIADDVVVNDGPIERLDEAADALDAQYRVLAAAMVL